MKNTSTTIPTDIRERLVSWEQDIQEVEQILSGMNDLYTDLTTDEITEATKTPDEYAIDKLEQPEQPENDIYNDMEVL